MPKSRRSIVTLIAALVAAELVSGASAAERARDVKTLELGAVAPDFRLPGVDGKTYTLADFAGAKILVVVFTCNHCPTAQAYEQRIIDLHRDYGPRGVALVAISPNDPIAVRLDELGYTDLGDSLDDMKIRARDRGFQFPYLYDGDTQETSAAYGVIATPHTFIFDSARKLRYVGRIDDSEVKTVKRHDVREALGELLAGEPVSVPSTKVFGCSTKWSDKRDQAAASIARWNAEPVELASLDADGLKELMANKTDKYRLVNVWATWCAPCIDELPEFVTMHRMYRKRPFEMVTISADNAEARGAALRVLTEHHVSASNYLFASDNRDVLINSIDAEWPGGLPYTVLIAPGGQIVYRKRDAIDPQELKRIIADRLGRTY